MQRQSLYQSNRLTDTTLYHNDLLQHTHLISTPKIVRFRYAEERPRPNNCQQFRNSQQIIAQTIPKKNLLIQSNSQRHFNLNPKEDTKTKVCIPIKPKFIKLTIKLRYLKTQKKQQQLPKQEMQISNHIEVLPLFPMIECGQCYDLAQQQLIQNRQRYSVREKVSVFQQKPPLYSSKIQNSRNNTNSASFNTRKKIFDSTEALNVQLKSMSRSRQTKILEPLELGNQSLSFSRSTSIKNKIFGEYSVNKKTKCIIKTQEQTIVEDVPMVIVSQWQMLQQKRQPGQNSSIRQQYQRQNQRESG